MHCISLAHDWYREPQGLFYQEFFIQCLCQCPLADTTNCTSQRVVINEYIRVVGFPMAHFFVDTESIMGSTFSGDGTFGIGANL